MTNVRTSTGLLDYQTNQDTGRSKSSRRVTVAVATYVETLLWAWSLREASYAQQLRAVATPTRLVLKSAYLQSQLLKARVADQRIRDCVVCWLSLLVCPKTAAGQQLLCREENKERRQLNKNCLDSNTQKFKIVLRHADQSIVCRVWDSARASTW